jgi:hypothetical protein
MSSLGVVEAVSGIGFSQAETASARPPASNPRRGRVAFARSGD